MVNPGVYTYNHTVRAIERLNVTVTLDGALAQSLLLNITSALPSAVNTSRSLAAAAVRRGGEVARTPWVTTSPLPLAAYAWHLLHVPVYLNGWAGITYADPKLGAQLVVAMPVTTTTPANNNTNATTTTTTQQVVFSGYWSSSNGSYLVPFKLTALGNITGTVYLLSNTTTNATLVGPAPHCTVVVNACQTICVVQQRVNGWTLAGSAMANAVGCSHRDCLSAVGQHA